MDIIEMAERIANDNKLPGRMVDWACDMFDKLNDPNETVRVKDLNILLVQDYEQALYLLDRMLP